MSGGRIEDIIASIGNHPEREAILAELDGLRPANLRRQIRAGNAAANELKHQEELNHRLVHGPETRAAFARNGVDMDKLSRLERRALESYAGDLSDEAVAVFAKENELPIVGGGPGE
jgi:hypothetical protein